MAAERSAAKEERPILGGFMNQLEESITNVLAERSEPLIFPYEKFEQPEDVALKGHGGCIDYHLEWNMYPISRDLAEAMARDYVERLYMARFTVPIYQTRKQIKPLSNSWTNFKRPC